MQYRGLITLDWGAPHDTNRRQELLSALLYAGWQLAETTAFTIETNDLNQVWRGIGLIAKGAGAGGTITALSFNIIGSDDFSTSRHFEAKTRFPNALANIEALPFPE